jgi:hypothetical protein
MASMILSGDTSGAITVTVPAVAGTNTITLPAATGTVLVSGNQPAFSAYIGSAHTLSASTLTKIQFNTDRFDTASAYDPTTNYRFTPLVAGYYQVNIGFIGGNLIDTLALLYKNGTAYGSSGVYQPSYGARPNYSGLVYCNGSTDYLEAYALVGGSTALATGADASEFSACLVRIS